MDSKFRRLAAVMAWACLSPSALAYTQITPTDLSGFTSGMVSTLIQTTALGSEHRAYMPATPQGMLLGIDIGIEATYLSFPSAFSDALASASGQSASQLPSGILLPKLNVHKGLPFGIDVGASLVTFSQSGSTLFSSYGGDVQWAFLDKPVMPTLALRASYSSDRLYFLDAHAFTLDVVASKNLILIDPYVGGGVQFWGGSIAVPAGVPLPAGISADASGTNAHFFAGAQLKLLLFRIAAQAEYTTAGFATFGGKFSIGF